MFKGYPSRRQQFRPQVEALETRLVPAMFVNATTVTYQDIDGDDVTIHTSRAIFTQTNVNNNTVLVFSGPSTGNNSPQQLEEINLTGFTPASIRGMTLSVTAVRDAITGGDGFANVGYINAAGIDLGATTIKGDLGRIDVGDSSTATTALTSLTVQSMGRYGTSTQGPLTGASLTSNVLGPLGTLTVKTDLDGINLQVKGGSAPANGRIGTMSIGGSLLAVNGQANSGFIQTTGQIGTVTIGGTITGGDSADSGEILSGAGLTRLTLRGDLVGGSAARTGRVAAQAGLGVVNITGRIVGGAGQESGSVRSIGGSIGQIHVVGDIVGGSGAGLDVSNGQGTLFVGAGSIAAQLNIGLVQVTGNVQGGTGDGSGGIVSITGTMEFLSGGVFIGPSVGGSLLGGSGVGSGQLFSNGNMGPVHVGHDIVGGSGVDSGSINVATGQLLGGTTVGGALVGGTADDSGLISSAGRMGQVTITGDIRGGGGIDSGAIVSGNVVANVTVGGSLIGGASTQSGIIVSAAGMGNVRVGGDVVGAAAQYTGFISQGFPSSSGTTGTLTSVFIGGSLIGGSATNTGQVEAFGTITLVTVMHDVRGGSAIHSGEIDSLNGAINGVTINGSLEGGAASDTGEVNGHGNLGLIRITGNLVGGSISGGSAVTVDRSGYITGDHISTITVVGSILAGSNTNTNGSSLLTRAGAIQAMHDIGTITVQGSIVGTTNNQVVISAVGKAFVPPRQSDFAIGTINVTGSVTLTNILAGYDTSTLGQTNTFVPITGGVNGRASINSVRVGGDWIQSNLVAGVAPGAPDRFGSSNDAEITPPAEPPEDLIARIASIVIGGQVMGTPSSVNPSDLYAVTAEEIDALSVGGTVYKLNPGPSNDTLIRLGSTNDVLLREVQ